MASLFAVGASPAAAVEEKADHPAATKACVGDAQADAQFVDVSEGHAHRDAINCIAYYNITNGTGDGSTFSPNQNVPRWQMALFMARAAKAADVDLGDVTNAGFSDIDDAPELSRNAINQLAAKGIIPKASTFRPNDMITRAEMAVFMIGLLNKAAPNVTITNDGTINLGTRSDAGPADDYFADARANTPRSTDAAISALYELGVTRGIGPAAVIDDSKTPLDVNYGPAGYVDRGQMAAFITRALDHTFIRPEGITAQYDGADVVVSVRGKDFEPVANAAVDVFYADTELADEAFRSDGTCAQVEKLAGTYSCEIDAADHITGGDGDARLSGLTIADEGTTVWVWTGDNGDSLKRDTVRYELAIDPQAADRPATEAKVTNTLAGDKARFGSTVTATIQLEDCSGDVTTGTDSKKPAKFLVTIDTHPYVESLAFTGFSPASVLRQTLPLITDDNGRATFPVAAPPVPANTDDRGDAKKSDQYKVTYEVKPYPAGSNAPAADKIIDRTDGEVIFSTEDSIITATAGMLEGDGDAPKTPAGRTMPADLPGSVTLADTDPAVVVELGPVNTAKSGLDDAQGVLDTALEASPPVPADIAAARLDLETKKKALDAALKADNVSKALLQLASQSGYDSGLDTDGTDDSYDYVHSVVVSVTPAAGYVTASTRTPSNRATVRVVDQYGDPVAGAKVVLESNAGVEAEEDSTTTPVTPARGTATEDDDVQIGVAGRAYTVGRDGQYSFGYDYKRLDAESGDGSQGPGQTETLTVTYLAPNPHYDADKPDLVDVDVIIAGVRVEQDSDGDDQYLAVTSSLTVKGKPAEVHWPVDPESAETTQETAQDVLAGSVDNKEIVVGTANPDASPALSAEDMLRILTYDANDRFSVTKDGTTKAVSMASFEKSLAAVLAGAGGASGTLTWKDYSLRTRNVVTYTLTVSGGC